MAQLGKDEGTKTPTLVPKDDANIIQDAGSNVSAASKGTNRDKVAGSKNMGAAGDVGMKAKFDVAADDTKRDAVDQVNVIPMTTINIIDAAKVAEAKSVIFYAKVVFGARGNSKAVSKATNISIPSKPTSSIMGMNEMHQMEGNYYNT